MQDGEVVFSDGDINNQQDYATMDAAERTTKIECGGQNIFGNQAYEKKSLNQKRPVTCRPGRNRRSAKSASLGGRNSKKSHGVASSRLILLNKQKVLESKGDLSST